MIKILIFFILFSLGSTSIAADTNKKPTPPLPVEVSMNINQIKADNERYERELAEYQVALAAYEAAQLEKNK